MEYTSDQVTDIKAREKEALEHLKRLELNPTVAMSLVNIGNDTFAIKPIPYLADTRYTSPINSTEL